MKRYAILVAGGNGNRMNAGMPKQFLLLADKPLLMHTLERFHAADPSVELIVVLPAEEIKTWKSLCVQYACAIPHHVSEGGTTRFQSVKNGLAHVMEKSIVAVHDGVRPFAGSALISRCFSEAEKHGNAVPFIPLDDSIRKVNGDANETADRNSFVIIQTPQCFDSEILKEVYKTDHQNMFTDDASVAEFYGIKIHLTEGEKENIKITFPADLLFGEAILKKTR